MIIEGTTQNIDQQRELGSILGISFRLLGKLSVCWQIASAF